MAGAQRKADWVIMGAVFPLTGILPGHCLANLAVQVMEGQESPRREVVRSSAGVRVV
jgi:hypothetical protein